MSDTGVGMVVETGEGLKEIVKLVRAAYRAISSLDHGLSAGCESGL